MAVSLVMAALDAIPVPTHTMGNLETLVQAPVSFWIAGRKKRENHVNEGNML